MEIDNKYLLLLHKLIYDPRSKQNGIISGLEITPYLTEDGRYGMWYKVFFNKIHSDSILYIDDVNEKRIKFLVPFDLYSSPKEDKEYQEAIVQDIKEYYGDNFSDDIIMRISEEKRQQQLQKANKIIYSLEDWDKCNLTQK